MRLLRTGREVTDLDNSWNGFSKLEFVPETRVAMALTEKYKIALEEYDDFGQYGIENKIEPANVSADDRTNLRGV